MRKSSLHFLGTFFVAIGIVKLVYGIYLMRQE